MAKDKDKTQDAPKKEKAPQVDPPQEQAPSAQQGGGVAPEGFSLNEEGAQTLTADYFAGSFAITEAMLAFGTVNAPKKEIKLDAKIVVSIRDAKRILMTFQQLIKQYEDKYGPINV